MPEPSFVTPARLQANYARVAAGYDQHAAVQQEIAARLADRLADTTRSFSRVLELGAGTGTLARALQQGPFAKASPELYIMSDLSPAMLAAAPEPASPKVLLDAATPLPFADKSFDLVVSNLMLPWIGDVPGCLLAAGRTLIPDGLLVMTALGTESFREFRMAFDAASPPGAQPDAGPKPDAAPKPDAGPKPAPTPHHLPLPDVRDFGDLMLKLGYALPVVDRDVITVTYPDFASLYAELRATGSRNLHPQRRIGLTGKGQWARMEAAYRDRFALTDGSLPVTLEVIYLTGWRPGPGQQKPLAPGSATVLLEEVLNRQA